MSQQNSNIRSGIIVPLRDDDDSDTEGVTTALEQMLLDSGFERSTTHVANVVNDGNSMLIQGYSSTDVLLSEGGCISRSNSPNEEIDKKIEDDWKQVHSATYRKAKRERRKHRAGSVVMCEPAAIPSRTLEDEIADEAWRRWSIVRDYGTTTYEEIEKQVRNSFLESDFGDASQEVSPQEVRLAEAENRRRQALFDREDYVRHLEKKRRRRAKRFAQKGRKKKPMPMIPEAEFKIRERLGIEGNNPIPRYLRVKAWRLALRMRPDATSWKDVAMFWRWKYDDALMSEPSVYHDAARAPLALKDEPFFTRLRVAAFSVLREKYPEEWNRHEADFLEALMPWGKSDIVPIVTNIVTWCVHLSTLTTWSQYVTASLTILSAVIPAEMITSAVDFIGGFIAESVRKPKDLLEAEDESNETVSRWDSMRKCLNEMKTGILSASSIPLAQQFLRVVGLLAVFGLKPQMLSGDTSGVLKAFSKWFDAHQSKEPIVDVPLMIIESLDFSIDLWSAFSRGDDLTRFVSPTDVLNECNRLIALFPQWRQGNLKSVADMEPYEYENALKEVYMKLRNGTRERNLSTAEKLAYGKYVSQVSNLLNKVAAQRSCGVIRPQPPCVVVYGASSIGKTEFLHVVVKIASEIIGFKADDENIYYPNEADDFDSGAGGTTNVVWMDEMGKKTVSKTTTDCVDQLLLFGNTVPAPTNQADLDMKGTFLSPKLIVGTTNNENLDIHHYASCPQAISNRVIFIRMHVLPEFALPSGAVDSRAVWAEYGKNDPKKQHLRYTPYTLDYTNDGSKTGAGKAPTVRDLTEPMTHVEALAWLGERLSSHHAKASWYTKHIAETRKQKVCKTCFGVGYCVCAENDTSSCDDASVESDDDSLFKEGVTYRCVQGKWVEGPPSHAEGEESTETLYAEAGIITDVASLIVNPFVARFLDYTAWLDWEILDNYWMAFVWVTILKLLRCLFGVFQPVFLLLIWFLIPTIAYVFAIHFSNTHVKAAGNIAITWFIFNVILFAYIRRALVNAIVRACKLTNRNNNFFRTVNANAVGLSVVSFVGLMGILKLYFSSQSLEPQGSLSPLSFQEIEERSKEENPWVKPEPKFKLVSHPALSNMTLEHVCQRVRSNVVRVTGASIGWKTKERCNSSTNAFMLQKGLICVPKHFTILEDEEYLVQEAVVGHGRYVRTLLVDPVEINSGLMGYSMVKSFSASDITRLFGNNLPTSTVSRMFSREKDGSLTERTFKWSRRKDVFNQIERGPGSEHMAVPRTHPGDCGSLVISESFPHVVMGFHCAGTEDGSKQAAFEITKDQVDAYVNKVLKYESGNLTKYNRVKQGVMRTKNAFGEEKLKVSEEYHERDPANFLTPNETNSMTPLGHVSSMRISKQFTDIRPTILLEPLKARGVEPVHSPIKFRVNRNYAAAVENSQKEFMPIPVRYMNEAVKSFVCKVLAAMDRVGYPRRDPLSEIETVNGIPGNRFIPRMKMNTSSGPMYGGKKEKYFNVVSEDPLIYEPVPEILQSWREHRSIRTTGTSVPLLSRVSLKDEPREPEKDPRPFNVCDIECTLEARRLFMRVDEVFKNMPKDCDSAVGINCINEEWNDLGMTFCYFNPDQCIEGDFSKWDMSVSRQVMSMVGNVYLAIAERLGYSEDELQCMKVLLNDTTQFMRLYNGSLFEMDGSQTSGLSNTVHGNGCGVSLVLRCVYYCLCEGIGIPFGDFDLDVLLSTLGDDHIMSSDKEWFNMQTIQAVLAKWGARYTDAGKSDTPPPFVKFKDLTFCKRKFRYDERLRGFMAPLAVDSIMRSLFYRRVGPESDEDHCSSQIDEALRELSRHERDVFDKYASILREICDELGISHLCSKINWSYDDWFPIHEAAYKDKTYFEPEPIMKLQPDIME